MISFIDSPSDGTYYVNLNKLYALDLPFTSSRMINFWKVIQTEIETVTDLTLDVDWVEAKSNLDDLLEKGSILE